MNVQQIIIKGIKEQLFYNDYLVLPNFGGFVLKSNSAHFSASGVLIMPPSKTVSFNVQLKQNDGILATWLQTQLNCNANEALNHLREFSEYCASILNTRRRLSINEIGFFYLDFENNICFEPQQDTNFLINSFGLAPISIQEIEPEIKENKKEPVFVDRAISTQSVKPTRQKTRRNYTKLISPAIIGLFFLSLLFLIVSNKKFGGKLQASLFGENTTSAYYPLNYSELNISKNENSKPTYIADANGIATLELENKNLGVNVFENAEISEKKSKSKTEASARNTKKFEIVLGCFSVLENANRLAAKLSKQNLDAVVLNKNHKGLYVVSAGGYNNKAEAIAKLSDVKNSIPKAWIKSSD